MLTGTCRIHCIHTVLTYFHPRLLYRATLHLTMSFSCSFVVACRISCSCMQPQPRQRSMHRTPTSARSATACTGHSIWPRPDKGKGKETLQSHLSTNISSIEKQQQHTGHYEHSGRLCILSFLLGGPPIARSHDQCWGSNGSYPRTGSQPVGRQSSHGSARGSSWTGRIHRN